jgi:hypothetical protein
VKDTPLGTNTGESSRWSQLKVLMTPSKCLSNLAPPDVTDAERAAGTRCSNRNSSRSLVAASGSSSTVPRSLKLSPRHIKQAGQGSGSDSGMFYRPSTAYRLDQCLDRPTLRRSLGVRRYSPTRHMSLHEEGLSRQDHHAELLTVTPGLSEPPAHEFQIGV